jgi:redox-sensitive bicupin YhaK (pirin superfamily)
MDGKLAVLAAPPGEPAAVAIHQDVRILATRLGTGQTVTYELAPGRSAWVQLARGNLRLDGTPLSAGDGAALTGVRGFRLEGTDRAEALVFDLA